MSSRTPLHNIIAERIRREGPMRLDEYMVLCLTHPDHGYYMTRDPFGARGDFTTAPEISQLFGEMIGIWLADLWIKFGRPERFTLVECGPGRGTLMADIMRATRNVTGFNEAAKILLMEISPVLKEAQKTRLSTYGAQWIESFEDIYPQPVFLIGNEFLDALPVRQFQFSGGCWRERGVGLGDNDTLVETLLEGDFVRHSSLMDVVDNKREDVIVETSEAVGGFIKTAANILKKHTGAALFFDYGYTKTKAGSTVQAMKSHRFENVLKSPGDCDLTAHVDFENIERLAQENGVFMSGPVSQYFYLTRMGIRHRADVLAGKATSAQAKDIHSGLARLIDLDGMGSLFKVCALCHDERIKPAGFHEDIQG